VVDMGAVKFVSSGADVMRPGIVELDQSIKKDELVVVVDQNHKKPLCIARALFPGEEIFKMKQGKVLKSLHWVGDPVWNFVP
jgi:PUA domain protein